MTISSKKLDLIKYAPAISELNRLLPRARVFISWWGQKMVSIPEYDVTVAINTLAEKYFHYCKNIPSATSQERSDCDSFLEDIYLLYERCDKELEKTKIYKYFIPSQEWKLYFNWIDLESRILRLNRVRKKSCTP